MRYRIIDEHGREVAGAESLADLVAIVGGMLAAERRHEERRAQARRYLSLWPTGAEGYSSLCVEDYGKPH